MVKETYKPTVVMMNICWVCGKPVGTWNEKIETVCLECLEETETLDNLFEKLEKKRSDNISRPLTFWDTIP